MAVNVLICGGLLQYDSVIKDQLQIIHAPTITKKSHCVVTCLDLVILDVCIS